MPKKGQKAEQWQRQTRLEQHRDRAALGGDRKVGGGGATSQGAPGVGMGGCTVAGAPVALRPRPLLSSLNTSAYLESVKEERRREGSRAEAMLGTLLARDLVALLAERRPTASPGRAAAEPTCAHPSPKKEDQNSRPHVPSTAAVLLRPNPYTLRWGVRT